MTRESVEADNKVAVERAFITMRNAGKFFGVPLGLDLAEGLLAAMTRRRPDVKYEALPEWPSIVAERNGTPL